MPSLIFRKGLDLKHAVAGMLADNYHSAIVERIKAESFTYQAGRLTVHGRQGDRSHTWFSHTSVECESRKDAHGQSPALTGNHPRQLPHSVAH